MEGASLFAQRTRSIMATSASAEIPTKETIRATVFVYLGHRSRITSVCPFAAQITKS